MKAPDLATTASRSAPHSRLDAIAPIYKTINSDQFSKSLKFDTGSVCLTMSLETILIIVLIVFLLGGGGWY
jgi:hypothetical protein